MITVSILLNGRPVYTRTAVNTLKKKPNGDSIYSLDDGNTIAHDNEDGVISLAHQILNTIKEHGQEDHGKSIADVMVPQIKHTVNSKPAYYCCGKNDCQAIFKSERGRNIHRARCNYARPNIKAEVKVTDEVTPKLNELSNSLKKKGGMPTAERPQSPEPAKKKGGFFRGIMGR